ncbi:MAG: flippase-like domain-containing protein [Myxococcales bacterium]|nr:flippase-like domain-containing protein [Myxococcales bacterium]
MKLRGLWLGGLLLLAVIIGATLFADARRLMDVAQDFPWWTMAAAIGLSTANYGLRALRFRSYMAALGTRLGLTESFLVFVAGFVLTVTPGKMGEVLKAWLLNKRRGVPVTQTATAVVAERVTDVIGLLIIASFGVVHYGAHLSLFVAISVLTTAGIIVVGHPSALPKTLDWLGTTVGTRRPKLRALCDTAAEMHGVLRTLCAPRLLAQAVILATVGWMLEAVAFRILLDGISAGGSLGGATVIYAMATLFGAASMLPGGVGGTEAVFIALSLQPIFAFGIDRAGATWVTLLIRFATLWWAVIFGGICWGLLRLLPVASADESSAPPSAQDAKNA